MISYKQYVNLVLNEGIIQVDKKILIFLKSAFVHHLAEKILPQIKKEEAKEQFQSLLENNNVHYFDYIKQNNVKILNNVHLGLTYNNNGIEGKFNYHVGVKSLGESDGATFHRGKDNALDTIKVSFDKFLLLELNEWLKLPTKEQLEIIIDKKTNQIEHELAHLVEWIIIKRTGKQKYIKKGYNENEEDYFTSEIEFEPMIITMVRNFEMVVKEYKLKNKKPMSVDLYKELSKEILSAKQYEEIDSMFVLYSKKITPEKYKNLAKKVYIELIDNIETLINQGYLTE